MTQAKAREEVPGAPHSGGAATLYFYEDSWVCQFERETPVRFSYLEIVDIQTAHGWVELRHRRSESVLSFHAPDLCPLIAEWKAGIVRGGGALVDTPMWESTV